MFSETWMNPNDTTVISNYVGYHSTRINKKGGGVSIFVHNKFTAEPIPSLTIMNDVLECVGVKINYLNVNYNFICVYRPPSASLNQFNNTFLELLVNIPNKDTNFITIER